MLDEREAYSAYVEACRELNHEPKTLAEWNGFISTNERRSIDVLAPVKWVANHFNEGWAFAIAVIGFAYVLIKPDWHLQPWWITALAILSYCAASVIFMIVGIQAHRAKLRKKNIRHDYNDSGFFITTFIIGGGFCLLFFAIHIADKAEFARVNAYFEDTSCRLHYVDVNHYKIEFFDNTEDGFYIESINERPTRSGGKSYWIDDMKIEDKLAEVCN